MIAEGEVLQLSTAHDLGTDQTRYEQVIYGKTAALFEAAAEVGGVIAGAPEERITELATYGRSLGMAFQLSDDFLDYGGESASLGKNTGDDFREGKVTLPVILAYARGDDDARAFWRRTIAEGKQTEDDLATALAHFDSTGALADTQAQARQHADRAIEAAKIFDRGEMRDALMDIAEFVVTRQS